MAAGGGLALKGLSWFLRGIEFCCCAIILGIYSYYLAVLSDHHIYINNYTRAVEGISGAGVVYTIFALLLVCCLGGIAFFSFLGMLLDLAFVGAFIFVAWATRGGSGSCKGFVNTPLGSGYTGNDNTVPSNANGVVILPSFRTACKLETACFAVAIVAIVFFFLSIFVEFALARHHKKEKAFGPSPNNGYTAGSPKRKFWQRKPKNRDAEFAAGGLAEKPDTLPAHALPGDATRQSYATDATAVGTEPTYNKYNPTSTHPMSATGHQTTTTTHTGGVADGAAYTPYNPSGATGTY